MCTYTQVYTVWNEFMCGIYDYCLIYVHRYRPDLCDWSVIENSSPEESNEIAFRILEKDFKIARILSADESISLQNTDIKIWLHYLEQICEVFRGEIPHVKHPKLDYAEFKQKNQKDNNMPDFTKLHRIAAAKREAAANDENGARKLRDKLPGEIYSTQILWQNVTLRQACIKLIKFSFTFLYLPAFFCTKNSITNSAGC